MENWAEKAQTYIDLTKMYQASMERILEGEFCAYCGSVAETVDHVIPRAISVDNGADNLVPACRHCNSSKTDFSLQEWHDRLSTRYGYLADKDSELATNLLTKIDNIEKMMNRPEHYLRNRAERHLASGALTDVLAYVMENAGCTVKDVSNDLGIPEAYARDKLNDLVDLDKVAKSRETQKAAFKYVPMWQ